MGLTRINADLGSNIILSERSIGFNWRKPWNLLAKKGEIEKWSEREDSNLRPSAPKADALPNCATLRHKRNEKIVHFYILKMITWQRILTSL